MNESKVQSEVNKIEVLGRGGNPVTISFGNASLLEPESRSFETEVKSILIEETNPSDQSQVKSVGLYIHTGVGVYINTMKTTFYLSFDF